MRYLTAVFAKVIGMGAVAGLIAACVGERPKNPGAMNGVLLSCPSSPNCVSSQATDEGHRIAPLKFIGEPGAAFLLLKQVLSGRRDTKIMTEADGYLRVEFHTTFFIDDAEFLLDRNAQVIHVRSASRLGYSDLGKNRSRMEDVRRDFETAAGK